MSPVDPVASEALGLLARSDGLVLDLAERAGILTAETRLQAEAAGLDDSDMVRMYRTFWYRWPHSFDAAVSAAIASR